MALSSTAIQLPSITKPPPPIEFTPLRGLLVTNDSALARAFRRELKRSGNIVPLEIYASLEEAASRADARYAWITVDLDGGVSPSDAVRVSRRSWPGALVAIVSYWWSEDERLAHAEADHVIHKPVRAPELKALFARLYATTQGMVSSGLIERADWYSPQ